MPLRFTIKWLLFAMAYVAIAAMAFKDGWWIWADLLWGVAWLAGAYALLNVGLREGAARAGAAGMVILMACYSLSVQFAPSTLPTERILKGAGIDALSAASPSQYPPVAYPVPFPNTAVPAVLTVRNLDQWSPRLRAAHGVGAMVVGLAGYWLGLWAWQHARPIRSTATPPREP